MGFTQRWTFFWGLKLYESVPFLRPLDEILKGSLAASARLVEAPLAPLRHLLVLLDEIVTKYLKKWALCLNPR